MYGETEYIPLLFLGRGRNRCKQDVFKDIAVGRYGNKGRGLDWAGKVEYINASLVIGWL